MRLILAQFDVGDDFGFLSYGLLACSVSLALRLDLLPRNDREHSALGALAELPLAFLYLSLVLIQMRKSEAGYFLDVLGSLIDRRDPILGRDDLSLPLASRHRPQNESADSHVQFYGASRVLTGHDSHRGGYLRDTSFNLFLKDVEPLADRLKINRDDTSFNV